MQLTEKQIEIFWANVNKTETCWLWTGKKTPGGYGYLKSAHKTCYTHRISYEFSKGPIPEGLVIDHKCRQRDCLNPDHLEAVTQKENLRRGVGVNAQNIAKTHCPYGHPYSKENTYFNRHKNGSNSRICKSCQLPKVQAYRLYKKSKLAS